MTHRSRVDENDNQYNEYDDDNGTNDVPLVELPYDELERLPGGSEPQEGGGRATGGRGEGRKKGLDS